MKERLEDLIFASALEASGIKRTKDMYTKAKGLHYCTMCKELTQPTYKLKEEYVTLGDETPYLFICFDCYEELPNG